MKQKHLTIMFTDVKEFTLRTSKSSREQLRKILELHERIISPVFKDFKGTIIKTIGDAFMVTFESPTDAVLCGMRIQEILAKHNSECEEDEKIEVRIAVNSGEVTMKDEDVYGEAVNIAARLEGIAEANDIYFTESVYLAMNKSEIPTAEIGYRHFKGIPHEIKVYKVLKENAKSSKSSKYFSFPSNFKNKKNILIAAIAAALIVLILIILIKPSILKPDKKDLSIDAKDRIIAEAKTTIRDVEKAIANNEKEKALGGIKRLERLSERIGNPKIFEGEIKRLREMYSKKFRVS